MLLLNVESSMLIRSSSFYLAKKVAKWKLRIYEWINWTQNCSTLVFQVMTKKKNKKKKPATLHATTCFVTNQLNHGKCWNCRKDLEKWCNYFFVTYWIWIIYYLAKKSTLQVNKLLLKDISLPPCAGLGVVCIAVFFSIVCSELLWRPKCNFKNHHHNNKNQ